MHDFTNIDEDGTVSVAEQANWTVPGLNNFRQNKQPDSEFGAPDAIVAIEPRCAGDSYTLVATVRNVGEAALPAGVVVGFYTGDPPNGDKVGELVTSKTLYPLESEVLELPFDMAPQEVKDGVVDIYAVVDDTNVPHPSWQECRTDNNTGPTTASASSRGERPAPSSAASASRWSKDLAWGEVVRRSWFTRERDAGGRRATTVSAGDPDGTCQQNVVIQRAASATIPV